MKKRQDSRFSRRSRPKGEAQDVPSGSRRTRHLQSTRFRGPRRIAIIPRLLRPEPIPVRVQRGGFVSNPVTKTDAAFLKHFVQLIAFLMFVAAVLIAL